MTTKQTKKMKPFDLQAAMRGEPIVTRDGRKAKFVAYAPESKHEKVITLIDGGIYMFYENGGYHRDGEDPDDLFMAPPPMRLINGFEYPEPVRTPLEQEQLYWVVNITYVGLALQYPWTNTSMDWAYLKRGVIHLTEEAAKAHAHAIILAGGGE